MVKQLYIIAGCNGAGKTTASYSILPYALGIKEFVNADEIAKGLSPFNPEGMAILAGKLMLRRISELLLSGESFAIETTLATRSYINLVWRAQSIGYSVRLLFFYLQDVELARKRVAERVSHGGHSIPNDLIQRRYHAGLHNLLHIYIDAVDWWTIYDNSLPSCRKVASGGKGFPTMIYETKSFENIKNHE